MGKGDLKTVGGNIIYESKRGQPNVARTVGNFQAHLKKQKAVEEEIEEETEEEYEVPIDILEPQRDFLEQDEQTILGLLNAQTVDLAYVGTKNPNEQLFLLNP